MDVDALRAELEKHLANNPDEEAPHGFRDRFDALLEQYQAAEGGSVHKAVLEQQLQQVRAEAEAAVRAAASPPAEAAPARVEPPVKPVPPFERSHEPADEHLAPPGSGLLRNTVTLVAAVAVLAAAYYFFRR
jgi:hypothetical protein